MRRWPSPTRPCGVADAAGGRAANPFESGLRALALQVPGLCVVPQVVVDEAGFRCRPDLVDTSRRLVLEADSYQFHGTRSGLKRDAERYNALVLRGWTVLRFTWEHVMFQTDYVLHSLRAAVAGPDELAASVREEFRSA